MKREIKLAIIGVIIVAVLAVTGIVAWRIKVKLSPSKKVMSLTEYYSIPDDEMLIILEDKVYEENARYLDGQIYISYDLLQGVIDEGYYWDDKENLLIYTTANEMIKAETGNDFYYTNKTKVSTDYVIVMAVEEKVWISLDFAMQFSNIKYQAFEDPNRVILQYKWEGLLYSTVKKATQLRTSYDIKSEVLVELAKEDTVMYVDAGGIQKNGFVKVMTWDGIRGYALSKCLNESEYVTAVSDFTADEYTHLTKENSVNMVWHMTLGSEANQYFKDLIGATSGVTVVAPTWFNVNSVKGTLDTRAEESYVSDAHALGLEVWAVFSNFNPDSANAVEVDEFELFSRSKNRQAFVNEIVAAAIKFNLDGINIDFEELNAEIAPHYIQFLRELSIKCRTNKIVLSVDNYVPASYNAFYDLEAQSELVDYVVIMGYDEHYDGSEEAGSVSSIGFINNAITGATELVPASQLIMGIPFYTRLWKETKVNGVTTLSSEALGMTAAETTLITNEVAYEWQQETGQFYAEYVKEDATYKIWLEEELSIEEKMKAINAAGLAGVAEWRLGFEKESVWSVIERYLE